MQYGEIILCGQGCPQTSNGKHHCEDYCRMCGGVAGLAELQMAWSEYREFLQGKYPPNNGGDWQFTCPHFQKIDSILSR